MVTPRIREFLRFCVVGFAGFATDSSLLELLVSAGLAAPIARIISMVCALQVAYLLHGVYTFRGRGFSKRRWLKFNLYNATGAGLNYVLFLIVLYLAPLDDAQMNRQLGLVIGTAVALAFNYTTTKKFVFTDTP
jgi:putative flippase GtrA